MEIDEFANDYRLKDKFVSTKDYRFSSSLARFIDWTADAEWVFSFFLQFPSIRSADLP